MNDKKNNYTIDDLEIKELKRDHMINNNKNKS